MSINLRKQKERLEEKRKELQNDISRLTEARPTPVDPIEASEGSQDFEEAAVDFNEMQQEQSIMVNQQALLQQVERALKRIEDGTYGKCIQCDKPIPEKRLEALPWAERDVECEEQIEARNLGREELYSEEVQ